jgi:hypothetical protein
MGVQENDSTRTLAVGLLTAWAAAGQSPASAEWRALPLVRDGKLDAGWKHVGWGGFVVDQGAARTNVDARGMGLLVHTREKLGDCQIRVVYRSEKPQSNSDVFVRIDDGILSKLGEKTHGVQRETDGHLSPEMVSRMKEASEKQLGAWYAVHHGYEVQIDDAGDSWHRTGAIYSLAEAASLPARPESEWRTMIVTLQGDHVTVDVDNKTVSNFNAAAANLPPRKSWSEPVRQIKRPTHGYIGLQNHDPGDVVWFEEVAVRRLPGRTP